jgi:transposase
MRWPVLRCNDQSSRERCWRAGHEDRVLARGPPRHILSIRTDGRLERLDAAIRAAVPDWSLCRLVTALMAMRGLDMITAATIVAEVGDLSRFRTPRELMAYVGIVPSEDSTGDKVKRGPITKTGSRRVRRMLVECTWSYQFPPRLSQGKQVKVEAVPQAVREIAWKAQSRLNQRYRALLKRGKLKNVAITAVAREFVGEIWAVAQAVGAAPAATNTKAPAVIR